MTQPPARFPRPSFVAASVVALLGVVSCSKAADPPAPAGATTQATVPGSVGVPASSPATSRPGATSRPERSTSTIEADAGPTTTEAASGGTRAMDIGGLTVEYPLDSSEPDPESGVILTAASVYRLPGESFDELADVDVTNRQVTSDGKPVVIYLFGSDTLFDVGSSTVKTTAEAALPAVVTSLGKRAPSAKVLVRGFTDSSGSASANQTLSEQRASAVADWLAAHGLDRSRLTTAGYGSTHPAAEESSEAGTALNRRIEIIAVG